MKIISYEFNIRLLITWSSLNHTPQHFSLLPLSWIIIIILFYCVEIKKNKTWTWIRKVYNFYARRCTTCPNHGKTWSQDKKMVLPTRRFRKKPEVAWKRGLRALRPLRRLAVKTNGCRKKFQDLASKYWSGQIDTRKKNGSLKICRLKVNQVKF